MATYEELIAAAKQAKAEGRTEDVQALVGQASELRKAREAAAEAGDEGFIESVGRGIVTAPISLAQGLFELGAIGIDSAFDTDALRATTDLFESVKDVTQSQTTAGKVTEELVGFGLGFIPIAGWLGRASHVARTGKGVTSSSRFARSAEEFGSSATGKRLLSSRAGLYGTAAAAVGVYDGMFSPDGRETLSDSFEVLPDALKTEAFEGETGRAEASRQFRNKLRQAAEATALSGAFDTALYGLGQGARQVAALPGVDQTLSLGARGITGAIDAVGRGVMQLPKAAQTKVLFDRYFSSTKGGDPVVVASFKDVKNLVDRQKNEAIRRVSAFDKALHAAARESKRRGLGAFGMEEAKKDIFDYAYGTLGEDAILSRYGPTVKKHVDEYISQGLELESIFFKSLEDDVAEQKLRAQSNVSFSLAADRMDLPDNVFVPASSSTSRLAKTAEVLEEVRSLQDSRRAHLARVFDVHQNPLAFYRELDENFMDTKEFKGAVDDVLRYMKKSSPNAPASPAAREIATREVLEMLNLGEIARGVSPAQVIKNRIQQVTTGLKGSGGLLAERQPLLKLSEAMLIGRKPIISASPALRALMGEITDPTVLMTKTINDLAETTEAYRFYRDIAGANTTGVGDALPRIRDGQRPMVVRLPDPRTSTGPEYAEKVARLRDAGYSGGDSDAVLREVDSVLQQNGYVKLGEYNPDSVLGGQYGDISGAYVPKELYANLTAPAALSSHPASQAASIVNQIKGLSQKMLVVPNLASRVRDVLGTTLMRVGTGNGPSLYNQDNAAAMEAFFTRSSKLDDEGSRRLVRKAELAGIAESNVMLGMIKDFQAETSEVGLAAATKRGIERVENIRGFKPVMKGFESFMENYDGFSKLSVMLGEEASLNEIFRGAGLRAPGRGLSDQADMQAFNSALNWMERSGLATRTRSEVLDPVRAAGRADVSLTPIEVIAGDRTKSFMPTYGEIGDAVRATDRALPFGNFTSFASETVRNVSNILHQGLKEMSSVTDKALIDEIGAEAAEAFARLHRARGAQRLMGLLTVTAIAPKAMVRASMNATGTTDEQMERLYEQAAPYLAGHDLIITSNDGEGNYEYVDLSYVAPYSYVTDAINAGLRAYSERGRLDKSEADQLSMAAFSTISSLADTFLGESIVFERVRDALPAEGFPGFGRGGVTSTGARIYNPEIDDLGTQVKKGFVHVIDSLVPAFAKLVVEGRGGDIVPGRLTRAMLGTPGARGQDYNMYEELARQVTGFTPTELNLRRDFQFSGKEYSPKRSAAKTAANAAIMQGDATVEQMISGWENYLDVLYRVQSELYNDIQGARTLGLSDAEIRRNLIGKAKLGTAEVNIIMLGQFYPGLASQELAKDIQNQIRDRSLRLVNRVPFRELNQLSVARMRQPLSPELYRRRQEEQAEAPAPSPAAAPSGNLFSGIAQGPAVTPAPVALPAPAPAAQQAQQAPARNIPPRELLGSDPVSQARNAEIAQRPPN